MPADERWVAIQRNPKSGSGRRRPLLDFLAALRRCHLRPRLFANRAQLDACIARPELRPGLHAVVAAGGDGTLMDVINRHPDLPVGILPLGTENLVARQFRIPWDGAGAARVVAEGRLATLDVGRVGGRRFAIMASVGFDADVIHRLHAVRTGPIRRATYIPPIWNTVRQYGYPELRIFSEDASEPVLGRMAVIANLSAYALRLGVVPTAIGDDGLLDVRVFHHGSTFHMLRYLYMVARGRHDALADVTCLRARQLRVESTIPVAVQADGDPAGTTPCEVLLEPGAARLIVPA